MKTLVARVAYGKPALRASWFAGKDFQTLDTKQYFSIRDRETLLEQGYCTVAVYCDKMRCVVFNISLLYDY